MVRDYYNKWGREYENLAGKEVKGMNEKTFLTVDEIAEILTVSKSKAYEIVRQLNKELKAKGLITVAARVSKNYFYERMCYSKE